jgi:hypothetical protein
VYTFSHLIFLPPLRMFLSIEKEEVCLFPSQFKSVHYKRVGVYINDYNIYMFLLILFSILDKLAPLKIDLIILTAPQVIYDVFPAMKLSNLRQGRLNATFCFFAKFMTNFFNGIYGSVSLTYWFKSSWLLNSPVNS